MQPVKSKQSLSEIKGYCENTHLLPLIFGRILSEFNLTYIERHFAKLKARGVNGREIFRLLFVIRFLDFKNVHQLMSSGISSELSHKKDVLYTFLNNPNIDWRRILWLFTKQALKIIARKTDHDSAAPKCLIIDDSILPKTGRAIEKIGKVYDHVKHVYTLGMKLLTLGYNDGKSFIPLDFTMHHEPGKHQKRGLKAKDIKRQFSKQREENSPGYKRIQELGCSKIDAAIAMVKRALKKRLAVDYVLADSWFTSERFIRSICSLQDGIGVIGLMKSNRILHTGDKKHKASSFPDIYRKDIRYCRKLKCHYIKKKVEFKGIAMAGCWVRMRGQQRWSLLISTDHKLSFLRVMEIYQMRWSIEVFFKDCKQNLNLNGCQSNDFDAHIASASLVFMNYTALALKKRFEDYETLGILFRDFAKIMLQETLLQRTWKIILEIFTSLLSELGVAWDEFMSTIIEGQERLLKELQKCIQTITPLNNRQLC